MGSNSSTLKKSPISGVFNDSRIQKAMNNSDIHESGGSYSAPKSNPAPKSTAKTTSSTQTKKTSQTTTKTITSRPVSSNGSSPKSPVVSSNGSSPKSPSKTYKDEPISGVKTSGGSSGGGSSSSGSSGGGSSSSSSGNNTKIESAIASVSIASVTPVVSSKIVKDSSANLTAQNMRNWKSRVDRTLSRDLLTSLKISYENALQLDKATASADNAGDLNLRFKELTNAMDGAVRQLATFVKAFDTDLNTYISTLEKAEKTTSDKMKTSINSFTDAANKINSLKM